MPVAATDFSRCTQCPRSRTEDDFYRTRGRPRQPCKDCIKDAAGRSYERFRDDPAFKRRNADRVARKRYGITLGELIERQGSSLCAVCGEREATCIDHDHETGLVRGALCRTCNMALHYIENEGWLARARAYLARR